VVETGRLPLIHLLSEYGGEIDGFAFGMLRHLLASAGYAVLQVEPTGSFPLRLDAQTGTLTGMEALLAIQREGVDRALAEFPWLDTGRMALVGESKGALVGIQLLQQEDRYRAAILRSPVTNLLALVGSMDSQVLQMKGVERVSNSLATAIWEASPLSKADQLTTPLLLLHGAEDKLVPLAQAEQLFWSLEKAGKTVRLVKYPGEGHRHWRPSHRIHTYEELLGWMEDHLAEP